MPEMYVTAEDVITPRVIQLGQGEFIENKIAVACPTVLNQQGWQNVVCATEQQYITRRQKEVHHRLRAMQVFMDASPKDKDQKKLLECLLFVLKSDAQPTVSAIVRTHPVNDAYMDIVLATIQGKSSETVELARPGFQRINVPKNKLHETGCFYPSLDELRPEVFNLDVWQPK